MKLLTTLENVSRRTTRLWLDGHAKDFASLSEFAGLQELWLYRLSSKNLPLLAQLRFPKLEILSIRLAVFPDLTSISQFTTLHTLVVWQCSKLRLLKGLEALTGVQELTLMQNGPLSSLEPIASLVNLEKLRIIGGVFEPQKVISFEPVARLGKKFKILDLSGSRMDNPEITPLARLPEPDEFGISARFFPLEQVAMLAAAFPAWKASLLELQDNPYSRCKNCGGVKIVLFKRRAHDVCPKCDSARIERFLAEFEGMVEGYKNSLLEQSRRTQTD